MPISYLVMKTYNCLILTHGFRPKRTTTGQILALRQILVGVSDKNMSCVITFIDFKKANGTVHRCKLIQILRAWSPEKAITASYNNLWAKVVTPDGTTYLFEITAGALQGDTLALFVFMLVLDCFEICYQWQGGRARLYACRAPEKESASCSDYRP
ncbi:uncharacterized protein [Asterias amurensis]|uniref:uncharacterized protein n=1 Tax=Asterias amurensis TaxID=7602 RepID=UPI003AB35A2E